VLLASVLIVNYNGGRFLPACLDALRNQTQPRHTFEVVLVDNASSDGSPGLVRSRYPWVTLVVSPTNLGFAGGNNLARRYSRGNVAVLLNNDTVPDPFWLEELLRTCAEHPGCDAASKLVFLNEPERINSGGLMLTRDGRGADAGFGQLDLGQFEAEREIFAGCGAALAFADAGDELLDADLFLYYEDLAAQWRARLQGRRVVFCPRSLVLHAHGGSAGDASPLFRYCVERNRALTSLRLADPFLALWNSLGLVAKLAQASFRAATGRLHWRHPAAVAKALAAYLVRVPAALQDRYDWRCASPCV
jgi:GT2 family glycosyltransferase